MKKLVSKLRKINTARADAIDDDDMKAVLIASSIVRDSRGRTIIDVEGNAVHTNTSLETLSQTSEQLSQAIESEHLKLQGFKQRRQDLDTDFATIAEKRSAAAMRLAAAGPSGDARATKALDDLDAKERAIAREQHRVDQDVAASEQRIQEMLAQQKTVQEQFSVLTRTLRIQELGQLVASQFAAFKDAYESATETLGNFRITLEELYTFGGVGGHIAGRLSNQVQEECRWGNLEQKGWKDAGVLAGLGWRFEIHGLRRPQR